VPIELLGLHDGCGIGHVFFYGPSVKIPIYQYVGFDFLILDEMW
jgi:hypothetical protein